MKQDFLVESRTYDRVLRGSWQAYPLQYAALQLTDEHANMSLDSCVCLWLPAGTQMRWTSGMRPLRRNCIQFFWPERWYMFSAFYQDDVLLHTYANVIQPALIRTDRVQYTDLDLSILIHPDLNYEVLTQVEFDHLSETLHYDEQTRVSALMALQTLTSTIQRSLGLFSVIPHVLDLARLQVIPRGN